MNSCVYHAPCMHAPKAKGHQGGYRTHSTPLMFSMGLILESGSRVHLVSRELGRGAELGPARNSVYRKVNGIGYMWCLLGGWWERERQSLKRV